MIKRKIKAIIKMLLCVLLVKFTDRRTLDMVKLIRENWKLFKQHKHFHEGIDGYSLNNEIFFTVIKRRMLLDDKYITKKGVTIYFANRNEKFVHTQFIDRLWLSVALETAILDQDERKGSEPPDSPDIALQG